MRVRASRTAPPTGPSGRHLIPTLRAMEQCRRNSRRHATVTARCVCPDCASTAKPQDGRRTGRPWRVRIRGLGKRDLNLMGNNPPPWSELDAQMAQGGILKALYPATRGRERGRNQLPQPSDHVFRHRRAVRRGLGYRENEAALWTWLTERLELIQQVVGLVLQCAAVGQIRRRRVPTNSGDGSKSKCR
jgi:hypothetical protein